VFLDLTAAYDTVWHGSLLCKLSTCMELWLVQLVQVLLRDCQFRVHMGDDISSWCKQANCFAHGSMLSPTLSTFIPVTSLSHHATDSFMQSIPVVPWKLKHAELQRHLTAELTRLSGYCSRLCLNLSTSNTSGMFHLNSSSASRDQSLRIGND